MAFAGQINDKNVTVAIRQGQLPVWTNPQLVYWYFEYQAIRDALMGELAVKRRGERYLPKVEDMTRRQYAAYLDRAVFYNMTKATAIKMSGKLMRRPPKLTAIPDVIDQDSIGRDGQSLNSFARSVAWEQITMGRVGVLLDRPTAPNEKPYLAGYLAENILNWTVTNIDGRLQLTEVILREISQDPTLEFVQPRFFASYRRLRLEPGEDENGRAAWVYRQYYYEAEGANADINAVPTSVITPTNRGRPFDFIPFVFFGAWTTQADIEVSPVYDINKLNFSHYKSYAQLEHGRFYTGLPVYYVQTRPGEEQAEYTIGSGVVWEVGTGEKPGILEFNGTGLKSLENACEQKERQVESLGGKLIDDGKHAGKSEAQTNEGMQNEQSVLLSISLVLDEGITKLLRWMAEWSDVSDSDVKKIQFETSKAFIVDTAGAREFRALASMYQDGVIPIEVVYDYLLKAEVIGDWMDLPTFKSFLESPLHFPNQLDTQARLKGFPDAITMWGATHPAAFIDAQTAVARDVPTKLPQRPKSTGGLDLPAKIPQQVN